MSNTGVGEAEFLVSIPAAVEVDHTVASPVHLVDVLPPFLRRVRSELLVPEAKLAQIFEDDFVTFDVCVAWLDSAVAAASKAVIIQVLLIAVQALPEYIAWRELDQVAF